MKAADLTHDRMTDEWRAAAAAETDDAEVILLRMVPLMAATPGDFRQRMTRSLMKVLTLLGDLEGSGPSQPLRLIRPAS